MEKLTLLLALFITISFKSFSQINFENGYYVNNSNQKVECLIKNVEWKNNPTEFKYKLSQDTSALTASIDNVKEFGRSSDFKYLRKKVKIDRSTDRLSEISSDKYPEFLEETLFLKVLIEGEASLFLYEEGNLKRYFYRIDSGEIKQLVYKRYLIGNKIGHNNSFKQQLLNDLKCETILMRDVADLKYSTVELEKFIMRFNECSNGNYTNYGLKGKSDLFNISIRPGLNYSNLSIHHSTMSIREIDFDGEFSFRFGIEAELILPFNRNKWSVTIEPTYQYYKSEKKTESNYLTKNIIVSHVDYKSLELPVGLRHYFFLTGKSKIFLNFLYVLDFAKNSSIAYKRTDGTLQESISIDTGSNLAMGFGYKNRDKYSVELRYQAGREVFHNYLYWHSQYRTISMIFGYSLF